MHAWNTRFLLGWPIFRSELLVSGRVCAKSNFMTFQKVSSWKKQNFMGGLLWKGLGEQVWKRWFWKSWSDKQSSQVIVETAVGCLLPGGPLFSCYTSSWPPSLEGQWFYSRCKNNLYSFNHGTLTSSPHPFLVSCPKLQLDPVAHLWSFPSSIHPRHCKEWRV